MRSIQMKNLPTFEAVCQRLCHCLSFFALFGWYHLSTIDKFVPWCEKYSKIWRLFGGVLLYICLGYWCMYLYLLTYLHIYSDTHYYYGLTHDCHTYFIEYCCIRYVHKVRYLGRYIDQNQALKIIFLTNFGNAM